MGNSLDMLVKEHVFWSDSKNVIYWLRNESRRFKPFVSNRVGEIHDSVSPTQWRHVSGKYNPADKATRGLIAKELVNDKEWHFGPSFLYEDLSGLSNILKILKKLKRKRKKYRKHIQHLL